jgi:hypothetical protein
VKAYGQLIPQTPCHVICLWGNLKDKMYKRNPHTLHELQESIWVDIVWIFLAKLQCVKQCVFLYCSASLWAQGEYFQLFCKLVSFFFCCINMIWSLSRFVRVVAQRMSMCMYDLSVVSWIILALIWGHSCACVIPDYCCAVVFHQ